MRLKTCTDSTEGEEGRIHHQLRGNKGKIYTVYLSFICSVPDDLVYLNVNLSGKPRSQSITKTLKVTLDQIIREDIPAVLKEFESDVDATGYNHYLKHIWAR